MPTVITAQDKALEYIESNDNDSDVMSLKEIEQLIKETDYNRALYELHKYIEKYPDRFDNAQKLIKTIMVRRDRYSVLTEKAIKSSEENPEDHETPSKIILEMKTLEKNPPEEIQKVIDLLEEMHLFKYYAYLFDTIQNESASLTQANDVMGAIKKVEEGFWVYKDEFLQQWKNHPEIISEAEKIQQQLDSYLAEFENEEFRKQFNTLITSFIKSVNDDKYAQANELYLQINQQIKKYAELRNNIYECSVKFNKLYDKQKTINKEITDASYLPFMQRFVSGISGISNSGIVGAIDYEYEQKVESMKNAIARTTEKYTKQYELAMPKEITNAKADLSNLKNAQTYTNPITNYSQLGKKTNDFYSYLKDIPSSSRKNEHYLQFTQSLDYVDDVSHRIASIYTIAFELNTENQNQKEIRAELKNNKNKDDYDSSTYIRKLFDSVSKMYLITGKKEDMYPENQEAVVCQNQKLNWTNLYNLYSKYVEEIFATSENAVVSSWTEISQSFIDDASYYEQKMKEYNQYALVYETGFSEKIDEETYKKLNENPDYLLDYAKNHPAAKEGQSAYKYPVFAVQMTNQIKQIANEYESTMDFAQNEFEYNLETHAEWKNNKKITEIVTKSAQYMERKTTELGKTKADVENMVLKAKQQTEEAQRIKQLADGYYNQSEQAYENGQLEKAENLLVKANEQYTQSLELEDNPVLRREVDEKQLLLSRKITDARNEIVVKESRELYTKARTAQSQDRYDDAELLINSAINKWAETHDEKNEEFESFRELVNTAVSMKTGRILLVSDPLYAEMSQLLSIAYQYYDMGKKYYEMNQTENGNMQLDLAIDSLEKIKKVYPINQEASLLMLKIDQLRDPDKFKQDFGQKIKEAVAKCKTPETQTEGYNALINYYSLDPTYKGLKQTIFDIEIELGMRDKPVDNSAIARSTRLTEDAQSQYNKAGNDSAKLNKALQTVNEAIKLNPNNNAAIALKDKISTKLGGTTTIVLSSEDQALLTKAKNEYQAGRIDEANILMIQILKNNPQNIKVKSVADLKKKIDARL